MSQVDCSSPDSWPAWLKDRVAKFEEIRARRNSESSPIAEEPIEITLPDGSIKAGVAGKTSPFDVAGMISAGLQKACISAKVDGAMWDLHRPFEKSSTLELLKFDSDDGKKVFWHSSAHILGEALEILFDAHLCIGPPLKDGGFYYEARLPEGRALASSELEAVNQFVKKITDSKQSFERLVVSKEEALEMFAYNKYKHEIVNRKVPDGSMTSVYRCGPLIDLCKGPHLPNTGVVKAFEATKVSSSYFLADAANDSLQRVYGVAYPDAKLMKEYKKRIEEAAKRDHRRIGTEQELFFFSDLSPGSAFFLPNGAKMYNRLVQLMRDEYRKRGYQEVVSPNVFKSGLWKTSGHWEHYQDDMFTFDCEGERFGLKPMNCPGHCVVFGHRLRRFKELPLRMAEFGVLHRNELSGTLSGLTRVRRFVQDDSHIFCRQDQIRAEILGCLSLMRDVYELFDMGYHLELSTRPKSFMGDIEVWNKAESELESVLNEFMGKGNWKLNPGDGAFYGPKIDIHITDALGRRFQCATVQLDFQLPIKFDLLYQDEKGAMERPVIVHRAILGSLERFFGILIEHLGGKWPLWLSPRQICILTVLNSPELNDYAETVRQRFFDAGFDVDTDLGGDKINKKIRNAEVRHYNYIFVIGKSEVENKTVNVRSGRDNEVLGEKTLDAAIAELQELVRARK